MTCSDYCTTVVVVVSTAEETFKLFCPLMEMNFRRTFMLNRYLSQQEILNLSGGKQRGEIVRLEVDWKGHRIPFTAKLLYNRQSQKYPAHQKGYLVFKDQSSGKSMNFDIALNTLELDLPVLGNTGMFFCNSSALLR